MEGEESMRKWGYVAWWY